MVATEHSPPGFSLYVDSQEDNGTAGTSTANVAAYLECAIGEHSFKVKCYDSNKREKDAEVSPQVIPE
jgi:hypothetical protein